MLRQNRSPAPEPVPRIDAPAPNRLRIGSQQAALGLLWQPAQAQIPLREQARMAGGPGGFDLAAPFGAGRQFGFASTRDGLSANMLAGASLFGGLDWGDNWLAAFALPGDPVNWWVVAMRERLVFEDQVHNNENAAKSALLKSLEAPDWEKIIAPADWDIKGADQITLQSAVSAGSGVKLRPVQFWPRLALAAVIAAIAAAVLYLGWAEFSKFRDRKLQAEKLTQSQTVVTQTAPWLDAPGILNFAEQCEAKLNRLAVPVPGWRMQKAECQLNGFAALLKLRWRRGSGSASWIKAAASELAGQDAKILSGGQLAEMAAAFSLTPGTAARHAPLAPGKLESLLRDRFLSLGLELKMSPRLGKTQIAADGTARIDFGYHTIRAATSASLLEHARLLSDIPALVPVSLTYQPRSAGWILTARAYHPAAPPGGAIRNWGE